jgi:ribosomal protein S11
MKIKIMVVLVSLLVSVSAVEAGWMDDLFKVIEPAVPENSLETTISGLKEALSVGTSNAVSHVSKVNGYSNNEAIKILMPEKIQIVADMLGKMGYQKQVDDFVGSMNLAAEKAAPKAKSIFLDAVTQMSFDDAKGILNGADTSATEYLKDKTSSKIYDSFKPLVTESLDQVGGTGYYNEMMKTFTSLPFAQAQSLDLNHYVTNKAMDGLFSMIGEEEKKIRTDPAARVTDVLEKVFTK